MPLTAAEKMRRRREKLKAEGKYEEYNKKIKERMRVVREKKKQDFEKLSSKKKEKVLSDRRLKGRERVAKCRRLKKEIEHQNSPTGYKNSNSLGKASARVRKVLPKSPTKRKSVVKQLFSSIVVSSSTEKNQNELKNVNNPNNKSTASNSLALSDETVKAVQKFYEREDISRQTPGMKDVISIKNRDGKKEKIQVRHLCYSLMEAHSLFIEETNIVIGKSKFAELRPKHVKLSSKLPHNVCLCSYHENFMNGVGALHKVVPAFPKYSFTFCEMFLCKPVPTQACWLGDCVKCSHLLINKMEEEVEKEACYENEVYWHVWKDVEGSLTKVVSEGSVRDLINYIDDISCKFFTHVYVKREQAASYNKQRDEAAKEDYDPKLALVQFDFSENYKCIAQDEIQSYHWVQPQVSLFTCSIWFGGNQHPYVIVSDNLTHSKDTLLAYVSKILDELPEEIKEVRIWSDGPSSQFKNRFIAAAIQVLQKSKSKKIVWNYFATSHGKGPVDGIGGAVKRAVRQKVLQSKTMVFNAEQFRNTARLDSTVNVILMDDQEILNINNDMNLQRVFEEAPVVKGISKFHAMEYNQKNRLQTYLLTKDMSTTSTPKQQPDLVDLSRNNKTKKRRPVYRLIYDSSSESDDDDHGSCSDVQQQEKNQEKEEVKHDDIKHGTFVKVEFQKENSNQTHTYVAICQTSLDSEMEVRVLCLSKVAKSGRLFKINTEETEPYIKFSQVLEVLPMPEIEFHGERMYFSFEKEVEVNEM